MFSLRIDLDTAYCVRNGVPKLLEMARKHDILVDFFVPMGGESGLLEVLSNRSVREKSFPMARIPFLEIARVLALPHNFAEAYAGILRRALNEGHGVGVHAWKHREWTQRLEQLDVREVFRKCRANYQKIFGRKAEGFAAPAFKWNRRVLEALEEFDYSFAGDMAGEKPFRPRIDGRVLKHVQVPVNLIAPTTQPLIEYYSVRGVPEGTIVNKIKGLIDQRLKKDLPVVIYGHGFYEGFQKAKTLEAVLAHVKKSGYESVSHKRLAGKYKNNVKTVITSRSD